MSPTPPLLFRSTYSRLISYSHISCTTLFKVIAWEVRSVAAASLPGGFGCCTCLHGCCRSIFCSERAESMWVCLAAMQLPSAVPSLSGGEEHTPVPPSFFSPLYPQFFLFHWQSLSETNAGQTRQLGQPPAIKLLCPCWDSGTNGSCFNSDTNKRPSHPSETSAPLAS